jgi:hypothetical protein
MSIKDWWVGPHEQVLNVSIACWWYGPSKPSSLSLIEAWLKPTSSLVGLGEKLGMDPWISRPAWGGCVGSPFSREQSDQSKSVGASWKVAICWPREIRVAYWSGFPLQGVRRFVSPRLSDMSTACLWQSSCRQLNEFNELIYNQCVLLTTTNCL